MNVHPDDKTENASEEADERTKAFEETYASVGVEVVTLSTTGSWRVLESDKKAADA